MEQGRQFYAAKQYPEAAEAFQKVINSCRCGAPVRKVPCLCKDILSGLEKDSLRDELKKSCICSAKSGRRCENSTHLDAFDSLAATYEKEDRIEQSLVCAIQMIDLSPREPKGYLRLGKVLRLQELPNLAYKTYSAGIELVEKKHPKHALLPKLRDQEVKLKRMMRVDPVVKLPFELVCMIFRQIDFRTQSRCLSVCKNWRSVLMGKEAEELWRIQHYSWSMRGLKRQVSPNTFMRYAAYAGRQVTDLSIDSCKYFGLTSAKLGKISSCCKQLRHLKLRGVMSSPVVLDDLTHIRFPALETLYIGVGVQVPDSLLSRLLQASPNIEELSMFDRASSHKFFEVSNWPVLNKLKTIRLANGGNVTALIPLDELVSRTRNVETVWIDDLAWATPSTTEKGSCWQCLQSIYIGDNTTMNHYPIPRFSATIIRELHLEALSMAVERLYDMVKDGSLLLDKIEKLSIKSRKPLGKSQFEALLRPSFTSRSIEELSIVPFPFARVNLQSEEMDWFRGRSLTCLSLTGLTLEAGRSIGSADDTLISIVNRFPNLECLEIDKETIQPSTLAKIVSTTRVRTIYHLSGYLMEEVKNWAAQKNGAQIINGYRPSPAQHPDRPLVNMRLAQSLRRPREN